MWFREDDTASYMDDVFVKFQFSIPLQFLSFVDESVNCLFLLCIGIVIKFGGGLVVNLN